MRFSTILNEDENYASQLQKDINLYLARLKANSIFVIETDMLIRELEGLGHTLTPESLIDVLRGNKYIQNATSDSIELVGAPMSTGNHNNKEQNRDKVRKLATKTAQKGIK